MYGIRSCAEKEGVRRRIVDHQNGWERSHRMTYVITPQRSLIGHRTSAPKAPP